jgi:hypothetical protein
VEREQDELQSIPPRTILGAIARGQQSRLWSQVDLESVISDKDMAMIATVIVAAAASGLSA